MSRTSMLSPADELRRTALRRMQAIALGALLVMAALFAVAFVLERDVPSWGYVRAAAEGGLVGGLADWFAVTALFRRPFALPIPHTAIIPSRKDEIGRSLGEFVETNFLSGDVVRTKLESAPMAARLGEWLREPEHAARVGDEASAAAIGVLRALSDEDVQDVISDLARTHLIDQDWATPAGSWLERVVRADAQRPAVDLAADTVAAWLAGGRETFRGLVSRRLPSWVPGAAHRFVDDAVYREAVKFVDDVRADPAHPARVAIDGYLAELAGRLQHDEKTRTELENAKSAVFDSPKAQALASDLWQTAKAGLIESLENPASPLRARVDAALRDIGTRLASDRALQARVDGWATSAAVFLVERYRHDIASIITDTIERWDARETSEKIELMVGKDLQFIRLNGTVVGALAGLAIYAVAHLLLGA